MGTKASHTTMLRPRMRAVLAAGMLLASWAGPAATASLQVAPTSLTLQDRQNAEMLWVSNSGNEPVLLQVRVFRWTQAGGEESLEPTTDLAVSPGMRTLAPGERQMVRIVRTTVDPVDMETAYRAIVDELPRADREREGLQFVLRYSIPVFVVPTAAAGALAPVLQARLLDGAGGAVLEVRNLGNLHAQIADLAHGQSAATATPVTPGLLGYVLPGQTRRWPLESPASRFAGGIFVARINGAADLQPLALQDAR